MELRKYSMNIHKTLASDETLLRLLYYKPQNFNDDPLDPAKDDVSTLPNAWEEIINDRVVSAPKFDDLEQDAVKCRLLFYPAPRRSSNNNYLYSKQQFNFETFAHFDYENVDKRLEWICDRVNELIFDKRIAGIGKVKFLDGRNASAPKNYIGYRLVYEFGSLN